MHDYTVLFEYFSQLKTFPEHEKQGLLKHNENDVGKEKYYRDLQAQTAKSKAKEIPSE